MCASLPNFLIVRPSCYLNCPKKSRRENPGEMRRYMRRQAPASRPGPTSHEENLEISMHPLLSLNGECAFHAQGMTMAFCARNLLPRRAETETLYRPGGREGISKATRRRP